MIRVIDNLLTKDNFNYYKKNVLLSNFKDVESQGVVYADISQEVLPVLIYDKIKDHGHRVADKLSFLRAYREVPGYKAATWIHSDTLFSDYIAIFMVQSSDFPQDDGVAFWSNKQLNSIKLDTKDHNGQDNKVADSQSLDPDKWDLFKRIEFKENRLIIAPASYYHSKATYGSHGKTIKDCRIVHVLFFNNKEE